MAIVLDPWGKVVTDSDRIYKLTYGRICPGWRGILKEILDFLPEDAKILQIKSKFGGLRVYTSPHYPEVTVLADKSFKVCEVCGQEAEQRSVGGWTHTVCKTCADQIDSGTPKWKICEKL